MKVKSRLGCTSFGERPPSKNGNGNFKFENAKQDQPLYVFVPDVTQSITHSFTHSHTPHPSETAGLSTTRHVGAVPLISIELLGPSLTTTLVGYST